VLPAIGITIEVHIIYASILVLAHEQEDVCPYSLL